MQRRRSAVVIRFPTTLDVERCPGCGEILTEDGGCRCGEIDWRIDDALEEPDGDGLGVFRGVELSIYLWLLIFAAWRVIT